MARFIIDTKNYAILFDSHDIFSQQFSYSTDFKIEALFGHDMYIQICSTVAEFSKKSNETLEISIALYDKIGYYKDVLKIWIQQQITTLENINPLNFPILESQDSQIPSFLLKPIEERYPELYKKFADDNVFKRYKKKYETLRILEMFTEFYSLVFEGNYENSLIVFLIKFWDNFYSLLVEINYYLLNPMKV